MTLTRLVAYGEAMLRLTSPPGVPLEATSVFEAPVGGAELNAAIAAVRSGLEATWVSTLPTGPLGDLLRRHCIANGVTPALRRVEGTRLGLYFLEQATPPRSSRIIYDRADSAFARYPGPETAWTDVLDADACLLLTGITPALSPEARAATEAAVAMAVEVGATVALDINYRATLWSRPEAFGWVAGILDSVDVLSASSSDLTELGLDGDDPYPAAIERWGLTAVVGSSKRIEVDTVSLEAYAATPGEYCSTSATAGIVDPIGAGDAAFGTFLAHLSRSPLAVCVDRAIGAMVTAYGLAGDALLADPWDLDGEGTVQR